MLHDFQCASTDDDFDYFLKTEAIQSAWQFADSGLNLILEEKHLLEMLDASKDPQIFEQWLAKESYLSDMYENADY